MSDDRGAEFVCVECGRSIWTAIEPDLKLCAECTHIPGWVSDEGLCRIFDPDLADERFGRRAS